MTTMTSHVDEGTLQALVDRELPEQARAAAERHLVGCAECREELATLRIAAREFAGAAALLTDPGAGERAVAPPRPARPAPRAAWPLRSLARAAVLVLGFAAAASATLPGSPVRRWVQDAWKPDPRVAAVEQAEMGTETAADAAPEAGVSVEPSRGEVVVVLNGPSPELLVRAAITEGPRAGVFATGAAAGARFSTAPGRIEVEGAGAGELRVELPRSARSARVIVNGAPYLAKVGDQLHLSVPGEASASAEVSFRVIR